MKRLTVLSIGSKSVPIGGTRVAVITTRVRPGVGGVVVTTRVSPGVGGVVVTTRAIVSALSAIA